MQFACGDVTLVDDYGHNSTEVWATLQPHAPIGQTSVLLWFINPIVYSYPDLYEDFVDVLSGVDVLLMLDVYAVSEEPIEGADSKSCVVQFACEVR